MAVEVVGPVGRAAGAVGLSGPHGCCSAIVLAVDGPATYKAGPVGSDSRGVSHVSPMPSPKIGPWLVRTVVSCVICGLGGPGRHVEGPVQCVGACEKRVSLSPPCTVMLR